jgi:hypothetical protein
MSSVAETILSSSLSTVAFLVFPREYRYNCLLLTMAVVVKGVLEHL